MTQGRGRGWRAVPEETRRRILRLAAKGLNPREIAELVGLSKGGVAGMLAPLGGVVRPEMWQPSESRLSLEERIEIQVGLELKRSCAEIGRLIGRSKSTVSREIGKHGGRDGYRPMTAHRAARDAARRPKPTKLAGNDALRERVTVDLEARWSPQQISRRLRAEFGDDESMQVSHETIYKSLYVQARGELRRELTRCLRSGRAKRVPQGREHRRGRIADMVMISERPAEAEDRAVPGHWEGDLILGKGNKSAVGTLVERSTRYVMLLHLPVDHGAVAVREAMQDMILTLPQSLRRSITWDQGKEMTEHARFTLDTEIPVYFCDPHSPWQRGSNENTNGLLRQYMPKSTDLSQHTKSDLDAIADSLNGRPRQTLDWMTPSEKLNQVLVALTG
ncbi:MAG: transposase, family [Thermoleophilia bacterium]|nr:transposase, family [Thermoleophilia bacterium]